MAGRIALPTTGRKSIRKAIAWRIHRPWTLRARSSRRLRKYLDAHGYITPNFTWASYACTDGTPVPRSLRRNAIRFHWRLERLRHDLGDIPVIVDGPYRTPARNRAVGGASLSRHMSADAGDIYLAQVLRWVRQSPHLRTRTDAVRLAERLFDGVGNETSGTLHLDTRGWIARFVTW